MTEEANVCVEILRKAARFGVADCQYCPAYNVCPTDTAGWNNECMFDTAADLIESLSAQLDQVTRERDAAESNKFQYETGFLKGFEAAYPKWISVEERLPEESGCVLCVIKTGWGPAVTEGYFWKGDQYISPIDEDYSFEDVTHWMPLPSPPKEDK